MTHTAAAAIVARLEEEYAASVTRLRGDLKDFLATRAAPDPAIRAGGAYAYPGLRLTYAAKGPPPRLPRAFARFSQAGVYQTTITRPDLFRAYLIEQLSLLLADFEVDAEVYRSGQEIPFPYVLDGSVDLDIEDLTAAELSRHFPATELASIGDEIADGFWSPEIAGARPLTLFDGPRTDFSLARLAHYTGAPADDVQAYVLFTNYHRYVDEFVRWGAQELRREGSIYDSLTCAGGVLITGETEDPLAAMAAGAWRRHQMPAYHLKAAGRRGVTLINIGVGPSNAKTITDHLAVMRPHAWLMLGHCAGLRQTQNLGDYVLAHAYARHDHVLDDALPTWVPLPALAEVQLALEQAVAEVTRLEGYALKAIMRTGTIATVDDRNWELRPQPELIETFNASRAIALDMESATIAANGFRFRVPYGTLLCVSDKPMHGHLKLPGMADRFYRERIDQHLEIGLRAIDFLRKSGLESLHSRKLRSFAETAFR